MTTPAPSSVLVGPFRYAIRYGKRAEKMLGVEGAVGLTLSDQLEILVSREQVDDRMRATLIHEVIHACADLADLGDTSTEEQWASRLGPILLQVLRDNPHLVEWLLENT